MNILPSWRNVLVESEQGQALVRFHAALLVLAGYAVLTIGASLAGSAPALGCVLAYAIYAYAWHWVIAAKLGRAALRQWASLVLDHLVFAGCFALGGRPVAFLAWVAVTTSVGHGLRFGERRGVAAACLGAVSIFAAVELGASWHLPITIALGMAATALVVPVYVVRLVRTMERQRHEAEARAQVLAQAVRIDTLTGVLSRAGFNETIRQMQESARASGERIGLVYIDLDGFKAINDTRGHDVGDIALREVANRLVAAVRTSDAIARLGGDEFVVIVKDPADAEAVARVADKVVGAIRSWSHESAGGLTLDASSGIAVVERGDSVEAALAMADMRMFEVKRARKQRRLNAAEVVATGSHASAS